MSNTIIKTHKLCKNFKIGNEEQQVLKNLDIEIYENDFTVIMGASRSR
jgi:putative ABC transport system ATP-binding protein